ncbi:CHRNB1 [Mytilus edulis]|uniref:CHRNB1 n=1 Tax=Mytilus edulis TaxID=6550 RepID=A0A8S3SKM5_MYTED|nr:CHRNB1 [Mytilus edulis]
MLVHVVIPFLLLTTAIKNVEPAYSFALEDNLRSSLGIGTTYNLFVRPLAQVNVTVALNIITLNSLSISDQSMSIAGYLTMFWDDQRLDWSQDATYNTNIPAIYSNEEYIWRPALIIENSVRDISIVSDANVLMKVQSSGSVIWTPSGIYITHCETDVTYYPFDTQSCDVIITTWGYTSIEIALYVSQEAVRLEYYKENGEWTYQGFSAFTTSNTREGSSTPEITFTLTFKRRPVFHVLNSLIPMVLLAFLSSMVFKLPPDSGERIGYSLTVLLAYAVYLTIISDNMPSTSSSTSVLTIYLLFV